MSRQPSPTPERLAAAKKMLDQGLISQSDFDAKKKEIMAVL